MSVLSKLTDRITEAAKKRVFGKTFYCPVCHLELAYADTDKDGLVVCPLCGVVIELADVWGHPLPVVNDVEINRAQPKSRLHPILTHAPIGLMPFALIGALLLVAVSLLVMFMPDGSNSLMASNEVQSLIQSLPALNQVTLLLLGISVGVSALTTASGYWDWLHRYGGRPYKQIQVKIALSIVFFVVGLAVFFMHYSGLVFNMNSGQIVNSAAGVLSLLVYFGLLFVEMGVIAILGHMGGNLVFGR